jgi:ornithine cyclodeaminase/alanine dehydrogenase-like protein (mu-crystallin family)
MARDTIILTQQDIAGCIDVASGIDAIERAMGEFERGQDYLPPKSIFTVPSVEQGTSMAACVVGSTHAAELLTMKVGQERSGNTDRGLPTTSSWINAFHPLTGELLMICDGTLPTMLRTAAAAAVATRHLARRNARTLTLVGGGQLGRQCLQAVAGVRDFARILVVDARRDVAQSVAETASTELGIPVAAADPEPACRAADVIVTATNSRAPIVLSDWVQPGTHLSCMGADLFEKIECEMALLPRCRLFADVVEHATARGEVSQAIQLELLPRECFAGTLGQVINGTLPGRRSDDEITLFDGVGIGIQDTTIARTIYDQAIARGIGSRIRFS